MPKSVTRLNLAEEYDKAALEHVKKAIEWEQSALDATSPAEREKFGEKARIEREGAINSLKDANIAFGPAIMEFTQDSDPAE